MRTWWVVPVTEVGRGTLAPAALGLSLLSLVACGGEAEHGSRATGASGSEATAGSGARSSGDGGSEATAGSGSRTSGGASPAGGASASGAGAATATGGSFTEFTSNFEMAEPLQGIGLWMGLGDELPLGTPPVAHDGMALHLVGDSEMGLDVFYHVPLPVERFASEVKFSAYSETVSALTIGVAGPEPTYFSDRAAGVPWPEQTFQVGPKWRSYSFSLDELSPPPPHEETFGAVHLVVQPGVHYDLWIDDFTLVARSR